MEAEGSRPGACAVRVVNIYATPWRFNGTLRDDEGMPAELSGLEQHYELYKEQLPRQLPDEVFGDRPLSGGVSLARPVDGICVDAAKAELFTLPSKQVVLAVTMCLADGLLTDERQADPVVEVLEQCVVGDIRIGELMVAEALSAQFDRSPGKDTFTKETLGDALLPERHQLVFVARPGRGPVPNQAVIDRILYRSTPPYRPEFVDPRLPKQLNTHLDQHGDRDGSPPPTLGVVTPYVSLLYGHRDYVEASIFLSTVHAVGTAARFRHIWREAYHQVLWFREQKQKAVAGQQTRDDLEFLADNLGNLEFDLTFSVEFPLLRIETFQSDLYDAMDLGNQAKTLSQMFDQLGGSLRSEITAIEVREQRRAESRQRWNSVAAGLLSLIGVPVGFVIAFLGINTTEVPSPEVSMWDPHYAMVYLVASAFALTPVFLIAVPYLREFALRRGGRRALWTGLVTMVAGALVFGWALVSDRHQDGLARIVDAIVTASGAFVTVVGLTLVLLAWRYVLRAFVEQPA